MNALINACKGGIVEQQKRHQELHIRLAADRNELKTRTNKVKSRDER